MTIDQQDSEVAAAWQVVQARLMTEIGQFQKQLCAERAAKRFAAGDKKAKCQMA